MDTTTALAEQIKINQQTMLDKYPKRQELTNELFDVMVEMMAIDYKSASPGGKRLDIFKKHMLILLTEVCNNGGHKNYIVDLIRVFKDPVIFSHLYSSFGNRKDELKFLIDRLERIPFWQGYEQSWLENVKKALYQTRLW
jgi:hypothetical protein